MHPTEKTIIAGRALERANAESSRKILARNLRRLMLQRGQSPAVFSMRSNLALRMLNEVLEGSAVPSIDLLDRMAAALDVTAAELLTEPKD